MTGGPAAYQRLSAADIDQGVAELPDWSLRDDHTAITRTFTFRNFSEAFGFMTECALVAERMNHHPEGVNVYSRVEVVLTTHDVSGLTALDLKLARAMDRAAARRGD